MFSPEVSNFKPHPVNVTNRKVSLMSPEIKKCITGHPLNHSVFLVFVDTLTVPQGIEEILNQDSSYYKVVDLPVYHLVEKVFIDGYIKSGQLTGLSVNTWLDLDNCFAITPDGSLIMSVTRSTFLSLGIEQSPAIVVTKQKSDRKYCIQINLKEMHFDPGKRNYERVLKQLKDNTLRADMIFSWEPDDEKLCPSSLAAYFHELGYSVTECDNEYKSRTEYNVQIPTSASPPNEVLEWLGAFSLGWKLNENEHEREFLSVYEGLEDAITTGQVLCLHWTGLITVKRLLLLYAKCREYVDSRSSRPLFGVQVGGFDDSPVSWNNVVHQYSTSGDNDYVFVVQSDGNVIISKVCISPYR